MHGLGGADGPLRRNPSCGERHGGAAGPGAGCCAASVRFIGRHTRRATELRRTFWISLGAVVPLFFGHFAQVGLWAGFLVFLGALQTYDDAFYFSLVTFARWVTAISFWRRATAFLARSGPLVVR